MDALATPLICLPLRAAEDSMRDIANCMLQSGMQEEVSGRSDRGVFGCACVVAASSGHSHLLASLSAPEAECALCLGLRRHACMIVTCLGAALICQASVTAGLRLEGPEYHGAWPQQPAELPATHSTL